MSAEEVTQVVEASPPKGALGEWVAEVGPPLRAGAGELRLARAHAIGHAAFIALKR